MDEVIFYFEGDYVYVLPYGDEILPYKIDSVEMELPSKMAEKLRNAAAETKDRLKEAFVLDYNNLVPNFETAYNLSRINQDEIYWRRDSNNPDDIKTFSFNQAVRIESPKILKLDGMELRIKLDHKKKCHGLQNARIRAKNANGRYWRFEGGGSTLCIYDNSNKGEPIIQRFPMDKVKMELKL